MSGITKSAFQAAFEKHVADLLVQIPNLPLDQLEANRRNFDEWRERQGFDDRAVTASLRWELDKKLEVRIKELKAAQSVQQPAPALVDRAGPTVNSTTTSAVSSASSGVLSSSKADGEEADRLRHFQATAVVMLKGLPGMKSTTYESSMRTLTTQYNSLSPAHQAFVNDGYQSALKKAQENFDVQSQKENEAQAISNSASAASSSSSSASAPSAAAPASASVESVAVIERFTKLIDTLERHNTGNNSTQRDIETLEQRKIDLVESFNEKSPAVKDAIKARYEATIAKIDAQINLIKEKIAPAAAAPAESSSASATSSASAAASAQSPAPVPVFTEDYNGFTSESKLFINLAILTEQFFDTFADSVPEELLEELVIDLDRVYRLGIGRDLFMTQCSEPHHKFIAKFESIIRRQAGKNREELMSMPAVEMLGQLRRSLIGAIDFYWNDAQEKTQKCSDRFQVKYETMSLRPSPILDEDTAEYNQSDALYREHLEKADAIINLPAYTEAHLMDRQQKNRIFDALHLKLSSLSEQEYRLGNMERMITRYYYSQYENQREPLNSRLYSHGITSQIQELMDFDGYYKVFVPQLNREQNELQTALYAIDIQTGIFGLKKRQQVEAEFNQVQQRIEAHAGFLRMTLERLKQAKEATKPKEEVRSAAAPAAPAQASRAPAAPQAKLKSKLSAAEQFAQLRARSAASNLRPPRADATLDLRAADSHLAEAAKLSKESNKEAAAAAETMIKASRTLLASAGSESASQKRSFLKDVRAAYAHTEKAKELLQASMDAEKIGFKAQQGALKTVAKTLAPKPAPASRRKANSSESEASSSDERTKRKPASKTTKASEQKAPERSQARRRKDSTSPEEEARPARASRSRPAAARAEEPRRAPARAEARPSARAAVPASRSRPEGSQPMTAADKFRALQSQRRK